MIAKVAKNVAFNLDYVVGGALPIENCEAIQSGACFAAPAVISSLSRGGFGRDTDTELSDLA